MHLHFYRYAASSCYGPPVQEVVRVYQYVFFVFFCFFLFSFSFWFHLLIVEAEVGSQSWRVTLCATGKPSCMRLITAIFHVVSPSDGRGLSFNSSGIRFLRDSHDLPFTWMCDFREETWTYFFVSIVFVFLGGWAFWGEARLFLRYAFGLPRSIVCQRNMAPYSVKECLLTPLTLPQNIAGAFLPCFFRAALKRVLQRYYPWAECGHPARPVLTPRVGASVYRADNTHMTHAMIEVHHVRSELLT